MPIYKGSNKVSGLYEGNTDIVKAYSGANEVFSGSSVSKAGFFDGTNYGDGGYNTEYNLQNFEYEWRGVWNNSASNRIFGINQSNTSDQRTGHILFATTGWGVGFQYTPNSTTSTNIFHTLLFDDLIGELVIVGIKKYGTSFDFTVNGITDEFVFNDTLVYAPTSGAITVVGIRSLLITPLPFLGTMNYCRYYELDESGNRISSLINYDFNTGDSDIVPNSASNAPDGSQMIWTPSGSGVYV